MQSNQECCAMVHDYAVSVAYYTIMLLLPLSPVLCKIGAGDDAKTAESAPSGSPLWRARRPSSTHTRCDVTRTCKPCGPAFQSSACRSLAAFSVSLQS